MRILLSCLCAALLLGSATGSRACKYCQMMAADPESARLSAQVGGDGSFPLDSVTDKFAPAAPAANLIAPPSAASVATRASDLPSTIIHRPAAPPPAAKTQGLAAPKPVPVAAISSGSQHWADAGLLGLVAAGGLFCWRTRRATVSLP